MIATLVFLLLLAFLGMIFSVHMLHRNRKVFNFLSKCNHMSYEWTDRHYKEIINGDEKSAYDWFFNKLPEYKYLLFHAIPLKLESFFTDEEIKKITS